MSRTGAFRFQRASRAAARNGATGLEIRALKRDDEPDLRIFFSRVSDESIHRRFMHMRRGMREEQLEKLLRGDKAQIFTLVAILTEDIGREVAGIGECFVEPDGRTAEFGLLVRDDLQGKGIGTALLAALRAEMTARGITTLTASVLPGNVAMLHIAGKAGFKNRGGLRDGMLSIRANLVPAPARAGPAGGK